MRRFQLVLLTGALPVLLLSIGLPGCGKKGADDDDDLPPTRRASTGGTVKKKQLKAITAKEFGVITGKISWTGAEPDMEALTAKLQASMSKDKDYCLSGKEYEKTQQEYRIGKNKQLGNVFLWIQPAERGSYFEVPEDQLKAIPKEVRISQPHCAFLPHCVVTFPSYYKDGELVPTNQKLIVENDATVSHNAAVEGGADNPRVDVQLGPGANKDYVLKPERSEVKIGCGIHPWMRGYIRVFDHPYAAVSSVGGDIKKKEYENLSDPKVGTFEIRGVPVGAKVRIIAWHEALGYLDGPNGREITLEKTQEVNFEAKAK